MVPFNFRLMLTGLLSLPMFVFAQINYDSTCKATQFETGKDRVQLQTDFSVPSNTSFVVENTTCNNIVADVTDVSVTGNPNSYTFSVTIASPDTGCNQYANWWEVISLDGQLIYRRVLGHSHITEQPFTRTGGPVNISANLEVMVRAWMHPTGYGGKIYKGSVTNGFECTVLSGEFAKALSVCQSLE